MNTPTDSRLQLLRVLVELARELPPDLLCAITSSIELGATKDLSKLAVKPAVQEKLRLLENASGQQSIISNEAMAFALRAAADAAEAVRTDYRTEIAWTGPSTDAAPLRRVDQVIYELLDSAKEEILLVTYAAYKAERALQALRNAADRGVIIRLVIELSQESGGKISFDGLKAFRSSLPHAEIFYWPLERRTHSGTGAYGSMHAKCLLTDRTRAIVSSANLTDFALETNMELGVVVEGTIALRLWQHFEHLIRRGELIEAP